MESTDKIQFDTSIIDKDDIILITLPTPKKNNKKFIKRKN